jgi:hypothetical protein
MNTNETTDHSFAHISDVIGRRHDDPALDRYDWAGYWPLVDEHLRVTDVLDSDFPEDDHVLADVRDGELAVYDGACDVVISVDLAFAKGFGPYLISERGCLTAAALAGRQIGRAIAKDALSLGDSELLRWTGIETYDGDALVSSGLSPHTPQWEAAEWAARDEFYRFIARPAPNNVTD